MAKFLYFFSKVKEILKTYPLFFIVLFLFCILHFFSWSHYYISFYGWIKKIDFFNIYFLLTGLFYFIFYSFLFYFAYSYGKRSFFVVVSLVVISYIFTIPFSLAHVDFNIKFIFLLTSTFDLVYLYNYWPWIFIPILIGFILIYLIYIFVNRYHKSVQPISKWYLFLYASVFILVFSYHLSFPKNIDEEAPPIFYYDNGLGRFSRVMSTFFFIKKFDIFDYGNLEGTFKITNRSLPVHGVYAILDTLEYEFLSIHGNSSSKKNRDLQKFIDNDVLLDFGIFYSCGSHTTASLPSMMSLNNCKIGPQVSSEPLLHLTKRLGVENYYMGLENLSQYFATLFSLDVPINNRKYVLYKATARALEITSKEIEKTPLKTSLNMVYYDAVHPGIRCEFLIEGGIDSSYCKGTKYFSSSDYKYGMVKAVEVIENDIVNFIKNAESNAKPIFLLLTSDHGLSPSFLHGDMADAEVSLDDINKATQRHSTLLFYANKSYRTLYKNQWEILKQNSKQYKHRFNHDVLFISLLSALNIDWDKKEQYNYLNIFSRSVKPFFKKPIVPLKYLQ